MEKKKSLVEDLIDITVAVPIGGAAIGIVGASNLPSPLKSGTSNLIGLGLFKGASKIGKK